MSSADFKTCLNHIDVDSVGLFRLFNFGEPLLHPQLPKMLHRVVKWGKAQAVEVSTNGQFQVEGAIQEALRMDCIDRLVVSCDGDGTPEDYERLRPPAKWDRLMAFLSDVQALKNRYGLKADLVTRNICRGKQAQRTWQRLLDKMGWEPEFRVMRKTPDSVFGDQQEVSVPKTVCAYLRKPRLYVDATGDVVGCCVHPRAFVLGSLLRHHYSKIVRGRKRAREVKRLEKYRELMDICGRCEIT